jgi:hypothetical protein
MCVVCVVLYCVVYMCARTCVRDVCSYKRGLILFQLNTRPLCPYTPESEPESTHCFPFKWQLPQACLKGTCVPPIHETTTTTSPFAVATALRMVSSLSKKSPNFGKLPNYTKPNLLLGLLPKLCLRFKLNVQLPSIGEEVLISFVALGGAPAPLCHIGSPLSRRREWDKLCMHSFG